MSHRNVILTRMAQNRPRGDRKSQELRVHLQRTFESVIMLEQYPRSHIDIFCEVLAADGGHLAACVNAASAALTAAGISMRGTVSACACALVPAPQDAAKDEEMPQVRLILKAHFFLS